MSLTGLATLGVALAAVAVGPRAWAQSVVVGPQANSVSASRNGLITVPVVANLTGSGGASLGSIAARLTWRPAILTFRGFTLGTAGAPVASADSATGTLRFAVANPGGLTGTPVLINARFEAVGFAGDTTNLNLAVDEITAAGTFANLLGITSATSSRFCVAGGRLGDLDANDVVNSFDALLIVTSAVGLSIAPNTTVNGDVDSDTKVDTRDALIVLSFAVGLPTAPYPVGLLNTAGCTLRSPTTVAVTPGTVGVAVGDRFPLAATTRDSVNAIISTGPVTWTSRDPLIATVDAFGSVLGVAAGSTRVVAMVTPTVMDSATVTVTGARRVWYVNPAVAAGNAVELGSQTYPFSSIPQATTAAAPGDTVRIAVASYGSTMLIKKSLVVIGDSGATGFPRLRNSTGPAVRVDTAGTVRLSRLHIEDSGVGVVAIAADTLDLSQIVIDRSRGPGISVRNSGYVTIGWSSINGAVLFGIDAESTATLRVRQTSVDLVSGSGGSDADPNSGWALRALVVDTVIGDTTTLATAGAQVQSSGVVTLRGVSVAGTRASALQVAGAQQVTIVGGDYSGAQPIDPGPLTPGRPDDYAVWVDGPGTATVRIDSSAIHDNGIYGLLVTGPASAAMRGLTVERGPGGLGQPVVKFSGVGSVTIAGSSFLENGYGELLIEDTPGSAATASVDSSLFEDTNLRVFGLASFAMRGGQVLDGYNTAVDVGSTNVVSLVGTEIALTQVGEGPPTPYSGGPWAVTVVTADSLRADSLWIHDNLAGALGAIYVTAVSAYGNLIEANSLYYSSYAVKLYQAQRARIAQSVIDDRVGFAYRSLDVVYGTAGGASVVVDTSTFWGPYYGVYANASSASYNDTLVVRGSRMQPGDGISQIGISVYAASVGHFSAVGNTLDTTNYGVYDAYSGSVEVRDNVIRNVQYYGVLVYFAPQGDSVSGNTIECQPGYYSSSQGVTLYYAPSVVTANTVRFCATGIDVSNYSGTPYAAEVRGNVVVGDSAYGSIGIRLDGQFTRPVVALNGVSAGRFGSAALRLAASGLGMDSARVDSNTVRDGLGAGIRTSGSIVGISLRGNVVERFDGLGDVGGQGGITIDHTGGGATIVNNRVSFATSMPGVRLNQAGGTITLDSNVVVDGNSSGVQLTGLEVTVTGGRNFLARNYRGLYGFFTVTMDQSTFQGNSFRGAEGVAAWNLANNYWGDSLGPRCAAGCALGSVGDSVAGVGTFLPFLAAPAVGTPVGAPPAIRPAPARTADVGAAPLRTIAGATRAVRAARALPMRSRSPAAAEARRRQAEAERARLGTPPGERRP